MPALKSMANQPILENSGLRVQCNGRGSVIRQNLTPGMKITKGQLIFIELGI